MPNLFSYPFFKLDQLNSFIILAIGLFTILTLIYSSRFMKGKPQLIQYYTYIILTAIAAVAAVLANNLILLLVFWGFLGLTLYLLINMGDEKSFLAAKKTLIIVGGSDALMIFGIGIVYYFTNSFQMDRIRLELNNGLLIFAYICIAIACFAKAGAMPFHSWVPDSAVSAPIPVVAYLPASLDKLLGIYLLARISLNLFVMNKAMNSLLMLIGGLTIIAAVMMALVQHNLKRLLGYHAVSQVGYMILGIGTGNPVGIAGGLFHMLNNSVYKSCLFFGAGNVEYRINTTELDELGGLGKLMPITYASFLIASIAISGVPPFNGFASKWLIYQGIILNLQDTKSVVQSILSVFCLVAAMFGSALTLASFAKLLHAVFLGQRLNTIKAKGIKEVSWAMWSPCIILAAICVIFGVFVFAIPLKYFIFPAVSNYQILSRQSLPGSWSPLLAASFIILALVLGFIIFKLGRLKLNLRQDSTFSGGEITQPQAENMVTGIDFYNTIKEMAFLRPVYKMAQQGIFDIYEQGKKFFSISKVFQYLHNGVLPTYLIWMLLGMTCLFFMLVR
ncbi:MAG: proton-conducting transporter membrane subunit [Candidatus Omnitrophica bacterium]|nr:proton-conducting transporter membrane subunit [Candidatus Omnitrophota bacterium]